STGFGVFVSGSHVVKWGDRKILAFPPLAPAVVGIPHTAVVAVEHGLWIHWIDPNVMHVAMRACETAHRCKTFAAVFTQNQRAVAFENAVRIFWINNEPREIERTPDHPVAFVALFPRRAAVIGNKQRARRRFDETINALGV